MSIEQRYARAEQKLERVNADRIARGPVSLVGVLLALCLAVGITAAVDLRRLQTPRGAALGWTGAAVFGDCDAYLRLSVADPDAVVPDRRSDVDLCRELRARTEPARADAPRIAITAGAATQQGSRAQVPVVVRRPGVERSVTLELRRKGDGWAVVRTAPTCLAIGCA